MREPKRSLWLDVEVLLLTVLAVVGPGSRI
jgi:hypothetical protein